MNNPAQMNPAHVPTLTEVIDFEVPLGQGEGAPIVTRGLPDQTSTAWSPMATVVLDPDVSAPLSLKIDPSQLPVLDAVVSGPIEVEPLAPPPAPPAVASVVASVAQAIASAPKLPEPEPINEAQLAQRVLGDVQKQIDGMIEFRLKEAIAPLLARHSEAMVRDLREELSRTMRDVVTRAVAQEVAKLRHR